MAQRDEFGQKRPLLYKHIENYLMRHAGYPDIATKPERHIFIFTNEPEARRAEREAHMKIHPGALREDSIAILYIKEWPSTPDSPPRKTVELLCERIQ